MELFINHRYATDVESVRVLSISDDGKSAVVVPVEKVSKIAPKYVTGGFCAHCLNNEELFSEGNYDIVECGKPYTMVLRKSKKDGDVWGTYEYAWSLRMSAKSEEECDNLIEMHKNSDVIRHSSFGYEKVCNEDGFFVVTYETTPTGKPRKCFNKYGKMVDHCGYYRDYNF